ncbi:MAG: cell division protein SepF [Ruminococcus sp.]|nr:cell division protein SepF [Ruminococcus sp.]MCD7800322.1 cell division protein SepF [Ruminococcus sp.]
MSLVDKFKDWFLVSNGNQDFDDDEDYTEHKGTKDNQSSSSDTNTESTSGSSYATNNNDGSSYSSNGYNDSNNTSSNYSSSNTRNDGRNYINVNARLEVVLVKPEVFTDTKQIADHLMKQKTVVLNLENAKPDNKRRIIDFLAGVAYAKGGNIKPVANLTYIITPCGVGFVGDDLVGELENSGVII